MIPVLPIVLEEPNETDLFGKLEEHEELEEHELQQKTAATSPVLAASHQLAMRGLVGRR